ncbi:MAG: hypothetical protein AAF333_00070 [Planctomycetota bacterium]
MTQMTIDCPTCGSPLLVPENAAGRKARCTQCSAKFVIPSMQEMLEQTVSHMVLEELDQRYHENEIDIAETLPGGRSANRPDVPQDTNNSGTILGMPAVPDAADPGDSAAVISVDDLAPTAPTVPTPTAEDPREEDETWDEPSLSADEPADTTESGASDYPSELRPTAPRPYLVVKEVSMNGVRLAFAAEWLAHEVFRTSMPIRCAFTGKGPEAKIVSRPMVFLNRCHDTTQQARSFEMKFEQTLGKKHSPREHVRGIGRMEGIKSPFDQPVLYYACANHVGEALQCSAHTDANGKEHCEVLIPHGEVAAEWVSRVNGRCGPEYALLKTAVMTLTDDAWAGLSEKCRRRLETWCRFERGEKFKLYLNDADLTASDAGLGGVVVTDRRLLYHKFRRSRSLSLNQDAVLHLRTDEKFTRLTLESHGRLARAGKIHRGDMDRLIQALADAPRLRVMVSKSAE